MTTTADWPELPLDAWRETRETLHLWLQVVGKVRLAHSPLTNHWWNVPLYVTSTGLTTSTIPSGSLLFQIDFDFVDHLLRISVSDGRRRQLALAPRSVADFYAEVMGRLRELGLETEIWTTPVEIPDAVPFDRDQAHASYGPAHARRFWQQLVQISRVLEVFRAPFLGKVSPVHLFWGALDLAVTRFSGRTAPPHPGGAPNVGAWVMREAYSHEVSSAGYWPGGSDEGSFYSYAYPEPEGFASTALDPPARYDADLGEFVLPYRAVRVAADPDAVLLRFLQTSYAAAADRAGWNRRELER